MRIALVSEHASPLATIGDVDAGGQNVYVAALSRTLAGRGHDVRIYIRRDDPVLPERVELAPGATVIHVPAGPPQPLPKDDLLPWMPAFGRWMARDWGNQPPNSDPWLDPSARPDLVHAHFWMSGLAAREAIRAVQRAGRPAVPHVQTFHALGAVKQRMQGSDDTSPPGRIGAESELARVADVVLATCQDEMAELIALGATPSSIDIVPCGVDLDHFQPFGPAELPGRTPRLAGGQHRLLSVGRLVERKGMATIIEALPSLPGTHLTIAGGPPAELVAADPQASRRRELAGQLGVADRVHLLGQVSRSQMPALMRWSDLVVATPWYEPFGMVPLEAMASGRAVVASATGGLLDTVHPEVTGVLIPPRDPDALAAVLAGLLGRPERRQAMGTAGRRLVEERYGWDRITQNVERVYTAVVSASPLLTAEAI